jgi:flavin-dependent dehydrogenase
MQDAMKQHYDVIVIGGGPGGAVAGMLLGRAGVRVLVVEKAKFPRFHIGESMLPRLFPLMEELGLAEQVRTLPHVDKYGAEFGIGDDPNTSRFSFLEGLLPGALTFNVERAVLDEMLLDETRRSGAEVREETAVAKILRLADGDVCVVLDDGTEVSASYLLDASGQATVVARHLGTRKPHRDKHLQKVAYFEHFENVRGLPGNEFGHPGIFMCREGWFWRIPINDRVTSVGLVMDAEIARTINRPANRMLAWGIGRCPVLRERMLEASGPATNKVIADFSYMCRPYAGEGHFLIGDAAAFMDPIFSTGVTLAMMSGKEAAEQTLAILQGRKSPSEARRAYIRLVEGSTGIFFHLIRRYYTHSFRELFLNKVGPCQVHRAIISIIGGQIFPAPAWSLRWRMWLFELCVQLNKMLPMVPRRRPFALLEQDARDFVPAVPIDARPEMATA